ncbi:MAG: polymerase subunit delta [Candidatus Petromonas sp.]|nr:polymerase subunit delta [Candidatus Petromonas sp.]
MDFKNLINDIKQDKLQGLYMFYGSEKYLIDKVMEKIKEKYINLTNESFNYIYFDDFKGEIDEVIDSCETLPFMGSKRIVIVDVPELFTSRKNILNSGDEDRLIKYFSNIPNTTCLIFTAGEKIDKRKKIVKAIKKYGSIVEFQRLKKQELSKWIYKKFKSNNREIAPTSLEVFVNNLGYLDRDSDKTLYDIENEIKKLSGFTADKNIIELDDIERIATKPIENNIFLLVDAVAEKKGDLALKVINQMLSSGEAEGRILYMIIRQFKILNQAKLMVEKGYTTIAIAPKLSLPQYIVRKYLKQAGAFTDRELLQILNKALQTEKNIKTGRMSPKLAIEVFVSECCKI